MKIILADNHSMITKGLKLVCTQLTLADIVEVTNLKKLMNELETGDFTHVVTEINFPDGSILDTLPVIRNTYPELHIAILTAQAENVYSNKVLQYGITYFMSKSAKSEEIARTLDKFFHNDKLVRKNVEPVDPFAAIAPREREILYYWLEGINTKEIARLLGVTMSTISTVKAKILEKTNTTNFVELSELAKLYKIGKQN